MTTKQEKPVCLRCSGQMEPGVMADAAESHKQQWTMRHMWFEGDAIPFEDWLNGKKPNFQRLKNQKSYFVNAYRCTLCGYLELYADEEA